MLSSKGPGLIYINKRYREQLRALSPRSTNWQNIASSGLGDELIRDRIVVGIGGVTLSKLPNQTKWPHTQ